MSFEDMKAAELREVATDWFGVDLDGITNKAGVIQTMLDEGVTYEMYQAEYKRRNPDIEEEPEEIIIEQPLKPAAPAPVVQPVITNSYLIKMDRPNTYYEAFGKVFTKEHPFAVCDDRTARNILERETGFRIATPGEAESFYG